MEKKNKREMKHEFHGHPLVFVEVQSSEADPKAYCSGCREAVSDSAASGVINHCLMLSTFVFDCPSFVFHKKCLDELPVKIHHPSHHHTLFLLSVKRILSFASYVKPNIPDTFILVHFAIVTSILNVLGRGPLLKIKGTISTHSPSSGDQLTRKDCKICFDEVKVEHGSYSCVVPSCNYEVHVNCALDDKIFYELIEEECRCEELNAAKQSSITRVIEVNEDGEATKIEHSSHEGHCLVLADKMEKETDRQCDGCMLPVSTQLYYCSESDCHFCLHKS
ncbi:uncharacterized protein LOC120147079 [Hibiscus syriacus]|uniref:uncharacterized protein LOC120147079 n=1 Tax=Hibiscus syriacus TaxID=106335 RepID=UPI0019231606|nr:uncharacterized protein LOC120147079 [Hibiscus syriacus]